VNYIESVRFAQDNRWLFEFITKPVKITDRQKSTEEDSKPEAVEQQLAFDKLLIMQDIKHPFSHKFSEAWVDWLGHLAREKNKKFKTLKSMQTAVDLLIENAKTEEKAIDMIKGSISNNWASIHEIETVRQSKKAIKKQKDISTIENLDTSWTKTGSE
jgi:hypothetical protein